MKNYNDFSAKSARQDSIDFCLAIAMVFVAMGVFADLVFRGGDSLFGQLFIWIAGLAA